MKILAILLLLAATPALADPALPGPIPPPHDLTKPTPTPDLDKPITTTLRKLQTIVAASVAAAAAQSAANTAKSDLDDLIKQATP